MSITNNPNVAGTNAGLPVTSTTGALPVDPEVTAGISTLRAEIAKAREILDRYTGMEPVAILYSEQYASQSGLNVGLTDHELGFINSLTQEQKAALTVVTAEYTSAVTSNAGTTNVNNISMPDSLQSRWADYVTSAAAGGGQPVDVNALVQWVLRESYMETSKDLYFYAEKVKFYNNVKKAIREEIGRARDVLVDYAGQDEDTPLSSDFLPDPPVTDFTGSTEASTATTAQDPVTTKAELGAYIEKMEEKLNSVGDDAQLANVDLQNMLQKQQQTMQMMSNIAKMLHDTAMAIIRKIGG